MLSPQEIVPHDTHPFIGVRPGIVNGIYKISSEVKHWHDMALPFKAIIGELEEDPSILKMSLTANPDVHFDAMLPHSHPIGFLVFAIEQRDEPTIVCASSQPVFTARAQKPSFESVKAVQAKLLEHEAAFARTWKQSTKVDHYATRVPFLYLLPGTGHFRRIENEDQFTTRSNLKGWMYDAFGNSL
ncbi:MAG: hypothetical protein AAB383_05265 [Patescibacteria group bacterium]